MRVPLRMVRVPVGERAQRVLLYGVALPLTFLFSLAIGAYWTFPYDDLRDYVCQEVNRGQRIQLEIEELRPSWLTGVRARGVRVGSPSQTSLQPLIRDVTARFSLFSLLFGSRALSFDAALEGGGSVDGRLAWAEGSTDVRTHLRRVDLARLPLGELAGVPVTGRLSGDVDFHIADQRRETRGNAKLDIRNLTVADGEHPVPLPIPGMTGGLTFAKMRLGQLSIELEADRGIGRIRRFQADGPDAQIHASGNINPVLPLTRTMLDMLLRIKIKDSYKNASPKMQTLFMVVDGNPNVSAARTADGALQWQLRGSVGGRIQPTPARTAPMPGL